MNFHLFYLVDFYVMFPFNVFVVYLSESSEVTNTSVTSDVSMNVVKKLNLPIIINFEKTRLSHTE